MNFLQIAIHYLKNYGFNILPLVNKAPVGDWIKWQTQLITEEDLNSFNWKKINGIGALCGINNLRCLDFDSVTDPAIVKKFLRALGLPSEYAWTVRSGSGKGYHIWFYCINDSYLYKILGGEKSYYVLKLLPACRNAPRRVLMDNHVPDMNAPQYVPTDACDHIELRWQKCQTVLPPSLHPSGSKYQFLYTKQTPSYAPYNVPVGRIMDTLEKFCLMPNKPAETETQTEKNEHRNASPVNKNDLADIAEYLSGRLNNYDDWMRIGFALASYGEQGREYFLQISRNNRAYNDKDVVLNRKFDGMVKDYNGKITIATLFEIAKKYGYKKPVKYFWNVREGKVKIYADRIITLLQQEGFGKLITKKNHIYIRDIKNIISEVSKVEIKDYLSKYIADNAAESERAIVMDYFIRCASLYCTDYTLEFLPTVSPDFITGTRDKEYFFFNNNFVEVTNDLIIVNPYSELKGKIWESQKSKHDFRISESHSEFQDFIERVCRNNADRINSTKSAIGYMLSSYKNPALAKAIIFIDEKLSENSHGRSGKGLVSKAIGKLKNALTIDGKNFSFDHKFLFQSVTPETQIIIFDDVSRKYKFEKLFSIITEGMTVEKKNINEYYLPYEKSPKILITTNHSIEGTDDSSLARQFVIEFSDHYNAGYSPEDEFGHLFFDQWDDEQWTAFYNYMIGCCKYYLTHGLKSYKFVNLLKKKLIDSTTAEFEEFTKTIAMKQEYNKKELYEQFIKEYEDFNQMRQNTFTKWLRTFAELNHLELKERKMDSTRYITFTK